MNTNKDNEKLAELKIDFISEYTKFWFFFMFGTHRLLLLNRLVNNVILKAVKPYAQLIPKIFTTL